jgi:pimeloyl-ACP methyl ester carboxylesterase
MVSRYGGPHFDLPTSGSLTAVLIDIDIPRPAVGGRVIALSDSEPGSGRWRCLDEALGRRRQLLTPQRCGPDALACVGGSRFALAEEAARSIELIDTSDGEIHLVGYGYGGAVALHAALARPDRVASLTLYEPSAFHLFDELGGEGAAAFVETAAVARHVREAVCSGDNERAAAAFVDNLNGSGTWVALSPHMQAAWTRWIPKAPLEFAALMQEPTPLEAYAALGCPVLMLCGESAPKPIRLIADALVDAMSLARVELIAATDHVSAVAHADAINARILEHIAGAESMQAVNDWMSRSHPLDADAA